MMRHKLWLYMIPCLIAVLLLSACQRGSSSAAGTTPSQRDIDGSLQFGGLTRTYHVHLPPAYNGVATLPLVFVFHGGLGTGEGMITLSHMNTTADVDGFITVYPDGYERSWADGRGASPADKAHIDDVGFISALMDLLIPQYHVDQRRIYATGISNGGFFTQRLACQLAGKFAAVASDAALLSVPQEAACSPSRPVPFLLIEGTDDPLVPFNGGQVLDDRGAVLSEPDTIAKWASIDGCSNTPTTTAVPDTAHDGTTVTLTRYDGCQSGASVAAYVIQGGGHTWPSGEQYLPVIIVGKTTHQIGNDAIWSFLQSFALPA